MYNDSWCFIFFRTVYFNLAVQYKNDIKKTWSVINEGLNNKKSCQIKCSKDVLAKPLTMLINQTLHTGIIQTETNF